MSNRANRLLAICTLGAFCLGLSGCEMQIDENMLTTQADYSVNISLPYATVTPPPAQQEQAAALVIDAEGGVTVNDSATVLENETDTGTSESKYKSLRQGNTGLAVQALQTRLRELGYYTQDVSGIFDAETEAAVRRFEQTYGTMQTGVATSYLQEKLFSADVIVYGSEAYNNAVVSQYSILQRGDVGSSVYALQQRLKNLGYPISELTGIFDNETANAVMLFYEAYGLTASEIANVALQKEIYSDSAKAYSGSIAAMDASASESLSILGEDTVAQIQQRLIQLGYLGGEANGQLDARTQLAVKLFEEACGQLPSGAINRDIIAMLGSENAPEFTVLAGRYTNLLEGSSGEDVARLQNRLVELGFATGSATGEYGSATTESVKLFQTANALDANGVATSYVQAVLFSSFALNIDGETAISALPAATTAPVAPAETPAVTRLSPGSTGDAVLKLQNRLTELGYVSSVTGTYDGITSRAITTFQTNLGCEPTGEASTALLAFIYSSAAPNAGQTYYDSVQPYRSLGAGDAGEDVTALQKRLWELDYLEKKDIKDSVGTVNDATQQSVSAVQADLGYETPDGIASAELQCYLFSEYCSITKAE